MNTLTLRSPTDMLAAVPYLLGFHPTDSVVLLGQRDTQVSFQVRCDTPKTSDAAPMAAYLATVAARQLPTAVIIIGYGPEGPLVTTLEAVGRAVEAAGVPVLEVLRVHDGRYWSLTCADPQCCAPGGAPFDASASAVAAAATYQGMVALPDRSALGEVLAPLPGPGIEPELLAARERLAEVVAGGARRRRVAARAAVREALDRYGAGGRLDDDEVAWLAVLLGDVRARDDAWRRMLGVEPCAAHEEAWRDMVRRVPERYVPAPATLFALAAWRSGSGTIAAVAARRALAADPRYALAGLVLQAVQAAIPPSAIEPLPEPRSRRRARLGGAVKAG